MALVLEPYPYQDEAIDMVLERGNGLIAYEMGLGKTVVGLAVAEELIGQHKADTVILVVPGGVKYQWAKAIARFTDVKTRDVRLRKERITVPTEEYCILVKGTPDQRKRQYRQIEEVSPDYVILGYEQVVNDWAYVKDIQAEAIILDEATYIKSFQAKRTKKVKRLWAPYRVALTGTPVENRADEAFSIMEWVDPEVLGGWQAFERTYIKRNKYKGYVEGYKNLDLLHERLKPVMARKTRLDPDVAPYMPDVQHEEIYVGMTAKSRKLYNRIAADLLDDLADLAWTGGFDPEAYYSGDSGGGDMTAQGKVAAKMMALQMVADHPDLLVQSAKNFDAWFHEETNELNGSKYAWQLWKEGVLDDLGRSEKFDVVLEDVHKILTSNPANKVILFSFFKGMLRKFSEALADYDHVIYDGDLNVEQKAAALARFQNRSDCRVFLSSDAGGMGVDLPQANFLVNYDQAYSSGKMDQRNARHVRADSSHSKVFVTNYLVEGSLEERIFSALEHKRALAGAVLDGKKTNGKKVGELIYNVKSLTEFLSETEVTALA